MDDVAQSRFMSLIREVLGPELYCAIESKGMTEVMVNPDGALWVERVGEKPFKTAIKLDSAKRTRIIALVASAEKTVCNETSPRLAAVLPIFGARFQGFVPPVVSGPSFTIRIKAKNVYTLDYYVQSDALTYSRMTTIWRAVFDRRNILIVGGTGSGKTTLANAVLDKISETGDRVVTIEDTPELQCTAPNHVGLFVREGVMTWQQAVMDSLRLRPDRIVVGEVRDRAALDLLKAWNTGHGGGCATLHANSAEAGLTRMEQLVEETGAIASPHLIAEAVNLVVHIKRTNEGRVVDQVGHVRGYDNRNYAIDWVA